MNLEQSLKAHEHEVAEFAMDRSENIAYLWKKYWSSNMAKFKAFTCPLGNGEILQKFTLLLKDFHPMGYECWATLTDEDLINIGNTNIKEVQTQFRSFQNC